MKTNLLFRGIHLVLGGLDKRGLSTLSPKSFDSNAATFWGAHHQM